MNMFTRFQTHLFQDATLSNINLGNYGTTTCVCTLPHSPHQLPWLISQLDYEIALNGNFICADDGLIWTWRCICVGFIWCCMRYCCLYFQNSLHHCLMCTLPHCFDYAFIVFVCTS
uniref:Uncharacterized protein n=1 Tax=Opuntia streptacantha TaxID=393608 RepID=A0A7C9CU30_OPUST